MLPADRCGSFPLIHSVWRCQLVATFGGGSRFQGCHGYLPFRLWLLLPANLSGTTSQAHLFVMSLKVKSMKTVQLFFEDCVTFNMSERFFSLSFYFWWSSVVALCCVQRVNLSIFEQKFLLGVGRAMWLVSEGVMHVRMSHQSVWVVSKNKPNCLLENKMVSTLIWRRVRLM